MPKRKETENSVMFDCLVVTHVEVFPFVQGPSMGHLKGLATVVLNDQLLVRGGVSADDERCRLGLVWRRIRRQQHHWKPAELE